jgi:hypothetical protein
MKIEIFTKFTGLDKDGNIIAERKEERANSLVQAFIAWLSYMGTNGTTATVKNTSNADGTMMASTSYCRWGLSAAGAYTTGIVAGTGTNAVAVTDYNLQTPIAHGTGAGQLSYAAVVIQENYTVSGSNAYFTMSRLLANSSGASITINEIGYVYTGTPGAFLFDRTLPAPYTVNNGLGVRIDYKWQVSA